MKASLALALALAFVAAGCGGAKGPSVAGGTTVTAAATTTGGGGNPALAYSRCMRAHGVPSFPDPSSTGGFLFPAGSSGVDPSSPAFRSAQAKCSKLMGGIAPGTTTHPTTQWLSHMVKVARCMRAHGVPGFPDPTTTIPQLPAGGNVLISDIDGAVFEFSAAIDEQAPEFVHAARACGFPLHNH